MTSDRPLHPEGFSDDVFQHPIKGVVGNYDEFLECYANDVGRGPSDDDVRIYIGVEVFRARNELGAWLSARHPDDKHKLVNHLFVDAVFPPDFEGEEAESVALLGRIDLAVNVMDAGGACTICGAPNNDGDVEHVIGCEIMSWMMFRVMQVVLEADGEPSLSDVVRAAHEQIARMD